MTTGDAPGGPRRRYRSPRRAQQAAETRSAVLAAAADLFAARGWAGTGMRDVAQAAGVSVETVYANFRSKGELFDATLDMLVVGDTEPVALADRPEFAALGTGPRKRRARAAAALVTGIQRRTAALHVVLRQAAASSDDLARRLAEDEERRRLSVEQAATLVVGRPVSARERDAMWALTSVEVYVLLTGRSGWTPEEYEDWLADAIVRQLAARHSARRF